MSLRGAKLICLTNTGETKKIIEPEDKTFRFGYYINCNYILENVQAKGLHCKIYADAFNKITIVNYCKKNPIIINGFAVKTQRLLFHGDKIKIFNDQFIWHFSKNDQNAIIDEVAAGSADPCKEEFTLVTPTKQQIFETSGQTALSEPWRLRKKQHTNRKLSVHSFAYCIGKKDMANNERIHHLKNPSTNTIAFSSEIKENIPLNEEIKSPKLFNKNAPVSVNNKTSLVGSRNLDCFTPIKSTTTDNILINFNTSIYKEENMSPQEKLGLCKTSDILVTSYSPKTPNSYRTPQSFAVIKSNKNTPNSIYVTPRSVFTEQNEHSNSSPKLQSFYTPQSTISNALHSSMHLIDLTTPAVVRKTPAKKILLNPLLKSALKNAANKSATKSVPKLKTTFSTDIEEHHISAPKRKFPVTPSSSKNISGIRKNLNISVNDKGQLVNTPNKMIKSIKFNKSGTDCRKTPILPLSVDSIDSSIEMEDLSEEESVIEVTDDSIYGNETLLKETPKSKSYLNTSEKIPEPKSRAITFNRSPKVLIQALKRKYSLTETSLPKSNSHMNTTPLRRSSIIKKITPRSIDQSRLSLRSNNGRLNTSSLITSSTPVRTNLKQENSIVLKKRSSTVISRTTPKLHLCEESVISKMTVRNPTPINSKTLTKDDINLSKKFKSITDVNKKKDQELGNESELNQTFTITESYDEENITEHEKNTNSINDFGHAELVKTPKEKQETNFSGIQKNSKNIYSNENNIVKKISQSPKDVLKTHLKGVRELFKTPKKEIKVNLVGIKELLNTPKNTDKNISTHGIRELFETPIKGSDSLTHLTESHFTQPILLEKTKDEIFKRTSLSQSINVKRSESKFTESVIQYVKEDSEDFIKTPSKKKTSEPIIEEICCKLSPEEKFDKLVGKLTITKQYGPSQNANSPKTSCPILNTKTVIQDRIELPKTDIQEWIDNLNETTSNGNIENTTLNLKNNESAVAENKISINMCLGNEIISSNESGIDVLQETKSVFSEELLISDKSDEEDLISYQSTPKYKGKLSKTSVVPEIRPIRRSSRHLNKSTQCLTSPTIGNLKNRLDLKTDFKHLSSKSKTLEKRQLNKNNHSNTSSNDESKTNFNLRKEIVKHPELNIKNNLKTLGNQIIDNFFDAESTTEEREMELAFQNFNDQPNLVEVKSKTPELRKIQTKNNRKTLGNQTVDTSFDLEAAKEERETELAFQNFNDQPNLVPVKSKTPELKKTRTKNNRKTLGNQIVVTSFDLEAAKEKREMELAFQNFNDQPNLVEVKSKTPELRKIQTKNNRKTLGNQTVDTSFDVEAAKEEREMELAFQNFNDQPNLVEVKSKTPELRKTRTKSNRKTLGYQTVDTSFDLEAAKEEREMELAFQNFNDQPNLVEVKSQTPELRKTRIKNNRKTLGNQTVDSSFDVEAAKEEREMELAFQNFNDQPNLVEVKSKTPELRKIQTKNNRKTLGNQTVDTSFDIEAAKEEREMELAFQNFNDQPNLVEVKSKTPELRKTRTKSNRKTLGYQIIDTSFDVEAAKEEREMELAFQNFNDQPNLVEVKSQTPELRKTRIKNNRKTLGNQTVDTSFDLETAKEEREMELAFQNFNDQPNLVEVKSQTPDLTKAKTKNNRKTLGNQIIDTSFDIEAAKEEREMELAFQNFNDQPNLVEVKSQTPELRKTRIKNNRKTLGNQTVDTSFDLEAAKEEREMELAFQNFNDQPNLVEVKSQTPDLTKAKTKNNRKTLGNQIVDTSFDLEAAKEEREMELAFQNFNDQPNLVEVKSQTPDLTKAKTKNNRKTLGNQIIDTSFDIEAAKEEREMELAFQNFNDQPNLVEVKAKTPELRKIQTKNNRKTLGNQIIDTSFDVEAAKEEREMELAFQNFNDQPNLVEVKSQTPDLTKAKTKNNRKTLGNQIIDTSFDIEAAKEEREMELAFQNFNDQPNLVEVKAKTPELRKIQTKNNRKTLGNQIIDTSFDVEAAKEEREMELAFQNFNDQPNLVEVKANTPELRKIQSKNNRTSLGNRMVDISFDLEAAKQEREMELAFQNPDDQLNLVAVKSELTNAKIQNNYKTLNNQTADILCDLKTITEKDNIDSEFRAINKANEKEFDNESIRRSSKRTGKVNENKQKNTEEQKKVVKNIPSMSRNTTRKQCNNIVEDKLFYIHEEKKLLESKQAQSGGRTRQQLKKQDSEETLVENICVKEEHSNPSINNMAEILLRNTNDIENVEIIENTPVKSRSRGRKQLNLLEKIKIDGIEAGKKVIESTPRRGRPKKQHNLLEEVQIKKNDIGEENKVIETTPGLKNTPRRGRQKKQLNLLEEVQIKKYEIEEKKKVIESTPRRVRLKKQLNLLEEVEIKKNEVGEEIKVIETTPGLQNTPGLQGRGRQKKQLNLEEVQIKKCEIEEKKKVIESTPRRVRLKKQLNLLEEVEIKKNEVGEEIKVIETTPGLQNTPGLQGRGKQKKQLNLLDGVQIKKHEIEDIKVIESTPRRGRSRKQINYVDELPIKKYEIEEENKETESTPRRARQKKNINNITEKLFDDNKKGTDSELEVNESITSKSRVRSRKQVNHKTEKSFDNKKSIEPALEVHERKTSKGRGRSRKQLNAFVEGVQENNNDIKKEDNVLIKTVGKLIYENHNEVDEKEEQILIKSNSIKKPARKQRKIVVENYDLDVNVENHVTDIVNNANNEKGISKNSFQQDNTSHTSHFTRNLRKLKVPFYFEQKDDSTENVNNSSASNHDKKEKDLIVDVNINNISQEKAVEQKENPIRRLKTQKNNKKKVETNSYIIDEGEGGDNTISKRTLRGNPSIAMEAVVDQSKRKLRDQNDSSASEDVLSATSITTKRRVRLHSEHKIISEDESATVKPIKSTRNKRKLEAIPIESEISEKRITRGRKKC